MEEYTGRAAELDNANEVLLMMLICRWTKHLASRSWQVDKHT